MKTIRKILRKFGVFKEHDKIIQYQIECLSQCLNVIPERSPLGIQIRLTLEKTKGL